MDRHLLVCSSLTSSHCLRAVPPTSPLGMQQNICMDITFSLHCSLDMFMIVCSFLNFCMQLWVWSDAELQEGPQEGAGRWHPWAWKGLGRPGLTAEAQWSRLQECDRPLPQLKGRGLPLHWGRECALFTCNLGPHGSNNTRVSTILVLLIFSCKVLGCSRWWSEKAVSLLWISLVHYIQACTHY